MEKIGVEAIVEGMQAFDKNMGLMERLVGSFGSTADQASKGPGILSGVLGKLGDSFRRVRDIITAMIIRDIFGAITRQIGDMVKAAVTAGIEFQNMSIRLETLLARDLIGAGVDATKAFEMAVPEAKDLFGWIQKLSVTTPLDTKDIANVFALAKGYGISTDMVKSLVPAITDFTAGMGLGGVEMDRIIQNFGQMIQQGKITGTELRDLGRGAFVPINELLDRTAARLGITTDAFNDLRAAGEQPPEAVNIFMEEFIALVGEQMPGAAQRASSTISGALSNVRDLTENLLGLNVLKPVFDVLGSSLTGFLDQLVSGERFGQITGLADLIGLKIASITQRILGLLPPAEELADKLVEGLNRFTIWLDEHEDDIVNFFRDSFAWIRDVGIPKLQEFSNWIRENWPMIVAEFKKASEFIKTVLVPAFLLISQWVMDHKDEILGFMAQYVKAMITWKIIKTVVLWIASIILKVIAFIQIIKSVIAIIRFFLPIIKLIGVFISGLSLPIAGIILAIAALGLTIKLFGQRAKIAFIQLVFLVTQKFLEMKQKIMSFGQNVLNINWRGIGGAIIQGIASGVLGGAGTLVRAAITAAQWAFNAAKNWLGINSPSTRFMSIGMDSMAGFAQGIMESIKLPEQASQFAAQSAVQTASQAIPTISNVTTSNTNVTNNFNQNIQSNAQVEPIINDFRALESAAQGA